MNAWIGYDPLVLAREEKMLNPALVKVIELSTSSETLRDFRNGLLDAAAMTLGEALQLADEGVKIRIIAALDASHGADLVLAAPDIQTLAQLKDATIAVEDSTVGALVLHALLHQAQLQRQDVNILSMETPQHFTALKSRRVDAAVSFEPYAQQLVAAGFHRIFDSSQMPGEIVDVLVVRDDIANERPGQVDALLEGWARGLATLQSDPKRYVARLAPGAEISPSVYETTLKGLAFYSPQASLALLSGAPPALAHSAERLAMTLLALNHIKESPDWSQLVDTGPAQRVQQTRALP